MLKEKDRIQAARVVYETYWDSYTKGDLEIFASTLDDGFEMIGTSETEICHTKAEGIEFLKSQIGEVVGKAELRNRQIDLVPVDRLMLVNEQCGIYVLVDSVWNFYSKIRISTWLRETETGWKVVQQHGSLPDMRVGEGETLAIDKISRENLELRDAVKRRTAELESKNRELEIEAALERVRTRAMAMHKSDEFPEVIQVVFEQFRQLNFNIDSAQFDVSFRDTDDFNLWTAIPNRPYPVRQHIPYKNNAVFNSVKNAKKASLDFISKQFSKDEKNEFFEFFFQHYPDVPEERKQFIFSSPGFSRSTVLLNNVLLGIQNYSAIPFTDSENGILKRFAKSFEEAYTRFLDLQKAEAQAREAQIQLALERVRAQTMAMRSSQDVGKCVVKMFDELTALGVDEGTRFGIGILNHENENNLLWTAKKDGDEVKMHIGHLDMSWHPLLKSARKAWKAQIPIHKYVLEGEELLDYYRMLNTAPDYKIKIPIEALPKKEIQHCFIFEHGFFYAFTAHEFQPELIQITKRFSSLFEQTYRRYLDLVRAEAQAREAQIEASLERVRSRSMAMHDSTDLSAVVFEMFTELVKLDAQLDRCLILVVNPQSLGITWYITGKEGLLSNNGFFIPNNPHPSHQAYLEGWRTRRKKWHYLLAGEEKRAWDAYGFSQTELSNLPDFIKADMESVESIHLTISSDEFGCLIASSLSPLSDAHAAIVDRFTVVFNQTYTRFLDLQKAEEQAREAQIEAALERVRARTMGMQKSEDLRAVVHVLYSQLKELGFQKGAAAINIMDPDSGDIDSWGEGSNDGYDLPEMYHVPYFEHRGHLEMLSKWKSGIPYSTIELSGQEKEAFDNHYFFHTDFAKVPVTTKQFMMQQESVLFSMAYMQYGAITWTPASITDEQSKIMQRFSKVFEQTYTRFLDLKRAEEQARQAQIEAALERVRARALAMQQPEELKEVAEVMRLEMGLLGVEELETSSIFLHSGRSGKAECWYAIKDIRTPEKKLLADHFTLDLPDTWVGRQMHAFYKSADKQISIPMQGPNRKEWINYCSIRSRRLEGFYGDNVPDRTYHLCKFSNGTIGAATPGAISEESWALLQRAASVFSLAYARFRDLTRARLDLQRLKEEKRRAETALSELKAAQAQLIHAEKMASLGELTAGIAHEIQNPLNFVNNFSEVNMELMEELKAESSKLKAQRDEALEEELWRDLQENEKKINHHGKRADAIVKGMLQHSRTSSGIKEPTDINALADEYLRLSYHGLRAKDKSFNADFMTELEPSMPRINVIPQDIGRVLLNLINNAFHAVSEKAKKGIPDYKPMVVVKTKKRDHLVEIRVKDNGDGIPDDIVNKIFQPFFTTKPTGEGTGLGLSLSYDIITKGHNGTLEVDTAEGLGSEFIVQLPIV
jgi:signal transduction histidine kinase